jgi:hypothetical protein
MSHLSEEIDTTISQAVAGLRGFGTPGPTSAATTTCSPPAAGRSSGTPASRPGPTPEPATPPALAHSSPPHLPPSRPRAPRVGQHRRMTVSQPTEGGAMNP